jgi:outer membrane protein assembly factor BamB
MTRSVRASLNPEATPSHSTHSPEVLESAAGYAVFSMYALHPSGKLQWNYTTGGFVASSPAIGADGTVFVGGEDFNVYAVTAARPRSP